MDHDLYLACVTCHMHNSEYQQRHFISAAIPNIVTMHEKFVSRLLSLVPKERSAPRAPLFWRPCRRVNVCRREPLKAGVIPATNARHITTSKDKPTKPDSRSESDINRQVAFNQEVFKQSIALSRSRMNEATELVCTVFDANGAIKAWETRMTKSEISKQFGIDNRDLRNVDLVSEGIPLLLVRPSTIFISIFSLRLLIQSDRVLLFLFDSERTGVNMQDVFEHDLQSRLRRDPGFGSMTNLSYELRVVDAALSSVIAMLEAEHLLLRGEVEQHLHDSKNEDLVHSALGELLESGKRLVVIEQRARQVRSALQELLNNDEDLACMYLSDRQAGKAHIVEDHQEVEYLLEAYYKNVDAIAESAKSLTGDVNRTARMVQSILDVRRNQIMIFEAKLEIWMLGFAASTFVAGLYGMNVVNYFESSASAFAVLTTACVAGTAVISRYGMWKLRKFRRLHL